VGEEINGKSKKECGEGDSEVMRIDGHVKVV